MQLFPSRRSLSWKYRNLWLNLRYQLTRKKRNVLDHIDYSYATLFYIEDYDRVKKQYNLIAQRKVQADHNIQLIERVNNDQTAWLDHDGGARRPFEFIDSRKTIDQVLEEATTYLIDAVQGRSRLVMDYIAIGTDTSTPAATDTGLYAEVSRKHILAEGGYIDYQGHTELYGLLWPYAFGSYNIGEALLATSDDPDTDLCYVRNVFNPTLNHTVNVDAIGIDIAIQHRGF